MPYKILKSLILTGVLIILSSCHPSGVEITEDLQPHPIDGRSQDVLFDNPELDPAVRQALEIYPLMVGSTWIYDYRGYDQDGYVLWRVVESVTESRLVNGYYLVQVERTAELMEGDLADDFPSRPETGTFWYLFDGGKLYWLSAAWEPDLAFARLELVIPIPAEGDAWYPDPQHNNTGSELAEYRQASGPYPRALSFNGIFTCFSIVTQHIESSSEEVFCERIGFVARSFHFQDRLYGHWYELVGFSIQ